MRKIILILAVLIGLIAASPASASGPCTSAASPGANLQTYINTLNTGNRTGCLHGGTYTAGNLSFPTAGTSGAPIELVSYPGERATIQFSEIYMSPAADYITLESLTLVGTTHGAPSIQPNGDGIKILGSDITNNHQAQSCIDAGYYDTSGFTLDGSTIHGCGQLANGNHDHGIYVEGSDNTTISNNTFYDNYGGWDIQAYPRPTNVTIEKNVLRASPSATEGGLIIAGDENGSDSTNGVVVRQNVLVGNGKASVFDEYQLNVGAAHASNNCIVPNGSPLFEGNWVNDGGNNTYSTEADATAACLAVPTPTPTPTPTSTPTATPTPSPTPTPTPTPTPVPTPTAVITDPVDGSTITATSVCGKGTFTNTTSVTWTLDNKSSTTRTYTSPPFNYTCWGVTVGQHSIKAVAQDASGHTATDINTFTRR